MIIPKAIADDVRRREGKNCRACGNKEGAMVFPLRRDVTTADDAIQICAECRAAERRRDLGMSGNGNGLVRMYGTTGTRTGHWITRVRL